MSILAEVMYELLDDLAARRTQAKLKQRAIRQAGQTKRKKGPRKPPRLRFPGNV